MRNRKTFIFSRNVILFLVLTLAATLQSSVLSQAASFQSAMPERSDTLCIMFWNLENFFDYIDSGTSDSDREFSSRGERHWSKKKFQAKCAAIAKTMMWVADREGRMPDIFAVAEVENRFVLKRLTEDTMIRKHGYRIVHYDSPDPRGIDVALLYRDETLELLESRPVRVHGTAPARSVQTPGASATEPSILDSQAPALVGQTPVLPDQPEPSVLVTRDILLSKFRVQTADTSSPPSGDTLAVLVNHHPSKYGGGDTDWRRDAALCRLKALKDSLAEAGVSKVIATGDFNDTPENTVFREDGMDPFINLATPLAERGEGTIHFDGKWELIDMFLVTPAVAGILTEGAMVILHPPFLTVRDNLHAGDKPLRTYSGPRYLGGVSDHRPILLRLPVQAPWKR